MNDPPNSEGPVSKRQPATPRKVSEPQVQLHILIPVDTDRRLRRMARQRGKSLAKLVRPWIIDTLEKEEELETPVSAL
jgi:hypothetical protein